MKLSNIFVVFDPTRSEQPALDRATILSQETGVNLHLFACIYNDNAELNTKEQVAAQKAQLDKLVQPLVGQAASVSTEVEWEKDWYNAVVRASIRNEADIVLKSSYKHSHRQRIFNKTSDWTLIRECQCPVLLVKEGEKKDGVRRILAAVDARDDQSKLNKNIVDFSKKVLESKNTEMHFVSAYEDSMTFPNRAKLIEVCGVDNDRIHVQMGSPEKVIVDKADALDISLVVIGSAERSGLSALVHGNTAEKILDDLSCDVLSMPAS